MRLLLSAFAIICLTLLAPATASADQKDPRLDKLFSDLKAAPDPASARKIDDQIWRIWMQHPDERTRESLLIGISFMNGGRAELAELAFKEAIERDPEFAEAWNKRATLRFLNGDIPGSIADCAHVLKLEPRHFGALSGLGVMNAKIGDWKAAVHWYEQALMVHPQLPGIQAALKEAKRRMLGDET